MCDLNLRTIGCMGVCNKVISPNNAGRDIMHNGDLSIFWTEKENMLVRESLRLNKVHLYLNLQFDNNLEIGNDLDMPAHILLQIVSNFLWTNSLQLCFLFSL